MSNSESNPVAASSKRYTPRTSKILAGLVVLSFLVAIAIFLTYERFWPVHQLEGLRLGMSEVDVTLALGKRPDAVKASAYGNRRELVFSGGPELHFASSGTASALYRICSSGPPYELEIYDDTTEKEILRRFGAPSFVSVSNDGTTKISSFERSNLAFEFRQDKILKACVSSKMPVRYGDEYGEGFKLQLPELAPNGGA